MADLIDRVALLEKLDALSEIFRRRGENEDKGFLAVQCGVAFAEEEVAAAPTVDAEPVVYDSWTELHQTCNGYGVVRYFHKECTAMGQGPRGSELFSSPYGYCPNCGARMDADAPERAGKDGRE